MIGTNDAARIFINNTAEIKSNKYIDVVYIEINLLSFVQIKKSDMKGKKLIYNIDTPQRQPLNKNKLL